MRKRGKREIDKTQEDKRLGKGIGREKRRVTVTKGEKRVGKDREKRERGGENHPSCPLSAPQGPSRRRKMER